MGETSLWVFGYGSLCWHPGFEYGDSVLGHIEGFSRRFWQGNTTHRGTPDKPGRVATLLEERSSKTHGVAFQLLGEAALEYLETRECTLGGYITHITHFHPRDKSRPPFPVLLYMATPSNEHWLGPAPLSEVAEQVIGCSGSTGHNVEYVLRLADWIRQSLPEVQDDHLFTLETHIRFKIKERNLCMKAMMRECLGECPIDHPPAVGHVQAVAGPEQANDVQEDERTDTFAFASTVARNGLRCLNV